MGALSGAVPLVRLILGGNVNNGAIDGVFCFNVNNLPSNSNWNNGGSLNLIDKCFSKMPYQLPARNGKNYAAKGTG